MPTMKNTPTRRSKKRGTNLPWQERLILVRAAESHLKSALEFAKGADAPMLAGRIRAAIKSAGGAIRHAELAPYREERQARKKDMAEYIEARRVEEDSDRELLVTTTGIRRP